MSAFELFLLTVVWFLGGISPGPATMAIAGTSMEQGRAHGVSLALGVFSGSAFWGLSAALGLGALMIANAWAVEMLRYVAAAYLIWLGYKSVKAALNSRTIQAGRGTESTLKASYLKGLLIHLTNPKPVFGWGAVFSVAVPPGSGTAELLIVGLTLGTCSLFMFPAYAWVLSTNRALAVYQRFGRWITGTFGMLFGAAGVGILVARQ